MGDRGKPKVVERPDAPEPDDYRAEQAKQDEMARIKRLKGSRATRVAGDYGGGPSTKKTLGA